MAEALWVQTTGVDYSAAEDRRLIWTLAQHGVARGLGITVVSGLQVKVAAGSAVIGNNSGTNDTECYVGYTTGDTTLTMPASSTTTIWMEIDPTTAATTITSGATPANPHLSLGSVTTGTSTVTGTPTNTTTKATPPSVVGAYLPIAGGTVASLAASTQLSGGSGNFVANTTDIHANSGVYLGGAAAPTKRHYARASKSSSFNGVVTGTWTPVDFGQNDGTATDYTTVPHSTSVNAERFYAGPAGDYALGGGCSFGDPTTNVGYRRARVVRYGSTGTGKNAVITSTIPVVADIDQYLNLSWSCNMFAAPGDYFEFQVWHNQGNNEPLTFDGGVTTKIWASMRLIMAD